MSPPLPNLFIFDDDPELPQLLQDELEAEGYRVEAAGTGQQSPRWICPEGV